MPLHKSHWPQPKHPSTPQHGHGEFIVVICFVFFVCRLTFSSSRATKYEEDLLRELRKAIGTAPTEETDMRITTDRLPTCQPDFDNCPIGWVRRGDRCVLEGMNAGFKFHRGGFLELRLMHGFFVGRSLFR